MEIELSSHAQSMLRERNIPEEWVYRALRSPDRVEIAADRNVHHIKAIPEYGGRFLRVVLNPYVQPNRIVTAFFDRRLRRQP